ncbi:enoyl-CoA hydratase-related protein [Bacillus sp. FJAT-50079]|uniref:enoyl-CoA hydratase-related protein n=1 Tax=Bacillus sp. FJAT-50079 TaxID=2833577 RepID=UPI001BCA4634|nr:enoyl-CoA hydratase-related protein [Bacillus sp. FJAT-50079]MBS4210752.1 enoyl-CoA hydratase/isomerase family protein [Bacillus sp. FJAT-50079]
MSKFCYIETEQIGAVGIVRLNRPEVLNALNRQSVSEILLAFEQYDQAKEIRVIVLCGKGKAFAAGADIEEMAGDDAIKLELMNQFADWDRLALIKKPIIGAVHGYCLGGGFELALICDLLFAAENTKFGFPEIQLAVMPGAGGTQRLTKLIGKTRAMEWLLSGEQKNAIEAFKFGIVNKLFLEEVLMEETLKFAQSLAEKPALSVRLIKEAVNKAGDYSLYEGMQFERKNFYLLFASNDQKEGMNAFMEKRKPDFQGD